MPMNSSVSYITNLTNIMVEIDYQVIEKLRRLETEENPNFLLELLEIFLQDVEENLDLLDIAIKEQNQQNIQFIAHKLKGYCGNFGVVKMRNLCYGLERSNSFAETTDFLAELKREFLLVSATLKTYFYKEDGKPY